MAPTAVRMVLVEGGNGDGPTVEEDNFEVPDDDDAATVTAAGQVVSAILGTREGAAEGGYQLASTGVTFTDPVEGAALRDALAAHKVENVMLVSAFLAAAALTKRSATRPTLSARRCCISSPTPRPWRSSTPRTARSSTFIKRPCPTTTKRR